MLCLNRMEDHQNGVAVVTHARLSAVELPGSQDLTDFWQEPESYFLLHGGVDKGEGGGLGHSLFPE